MTADDLLPKFRVLFPEFTSEPDIKVKVYLNLAITTFSKCEDATLYLAAHNLTMANSAGIGNLSTVPTTGNNQDSLPLKAMGVDGKNARFGSIGKNKDAQYSTTTYGLFFLQLRKACASYIFAMSNAGNNSFNYW
jgi:hypothetical protein